MRKAICRITIKTKRIAQKYISICHLLSNALRIAAPPYAPIMLPKLTQVQNPLTARPRFDFGNQLATTEMKAGKLID